MPLDTFTQCCWTVASSFVQTWHAKPPRASKNRSETMLGSRSWRTNCHLLPSPACSSPTTMFTPTKYCYFVAMRGPLSHNDKDFLGEDNRQRYLYSVTRKSRLLSESPASSWQERGLSRARPVGISWPPRSGSRDIRKWHPSWRKIALSPALIDPQCSCPQRPLKPHCQNVNLGGTFSTQTLGLTMRRYRVSKGLVWTGLRSIEACGKKVHKYPFLKSYFHKYPIFFLFFKYLFLYIFLEKYRSPLFYT